MVGGLRVPLRVSAHDYVPELTVGDYVALLPNSPKSYCITEAAYRLGEAYLVTGSDSENNVNSRIMTVNCKNKTVNGWCKRFFIKISMTAFDKLIYEID